MKNILPKITFKIDAEMELKYLKKFIDECGNSKIAEDARRLVNLPPKEAISILEENYKKENLEGFKDELAILWKKIEEPYLRRIIELTGYNWRSKEYICYITLNVPGFADVWKKKGVFIGKRYPIPTFCKVYVLAHELFHIHHFQIIDKEKLPSSAKEVAINESVPVILFVLDKELNKFWPYITLENSRKSYGEVDKSIDKLIPLWEKRKNFKDFIQKSIIELNLENKK